MRSASSCPEIFERWNDDASGTVCGDDGRLRCRWAEDHADLRAYHDEEWGIPVADDERLFEEICLAGFQSSPSWLTILRKRKNLARFDAISAFLCFLKSVETSHFGPYRMYAGPVRPRTGAGARSTGQRVEGIDRPHAEGYEVAQIARQDR